MWCVKSVEKTSNPGYLSEPIQVINLIDYDTGGKSLSFIVMSRKTEIR